ncbi:MAG: hypothetical protein R3B09_27825 [Nannocystaceae bacterium]
MRRPVVHVLATTTLFACNFGGGSATSAGSATASVTVAETTTTGTTGDTTEGESEGTAAATDTGGWPGFWPGGPCPTVDEEAKGEPRIYFDLGAGKDPGKDYFQLPFPIDVRLGHGGIDLEGFPAPPTDLDPTYGAVVDRWISSLQIDTAGFAVNGAILFRASREIGAVGGVKIVDVTPSSPTYGEALAGLRFRNENGSVSRGNYLCQDWLAVEPLEGVSLRPDTTYAVLLTDQIKQVGGADFVQDVDFAAMLAAQPPADARQANAWPTFAPLRDFLNSPANFGEGGVGVTAKSLIAATVFTTAPNLDPLIGARTAARDTPFVVKDLYLCAGEGDSPCSTAPGLTADERADRRCGPPSSDYHEIHGRVRLPLFQEGVSPYAFIGGKITVESGAPVLRSTFDACFALTVPKGSAPAEGWPALIFAHGTDGSFRTAMTTDLAPRLATQGVATIALEGVIHGERRGDTDDDGKVGGLDLHELVFNVFNPDSARDTIVQGAIDHFTAVRLAEEFQDEGLLGEPLAFDPARLAFFGHSQGANTGALFLPFESSIRAAVLSGGGSNLIQALLGKSEPKIQNPVSGEWMAPKALLQLAFQERPDRPLTSMHPMLVLLNTFVNRSDADNTARLIRREPLTGVAKHALFYIGHVDSYTPLRAAGSLAIGAGMSLGGAPLFPAPCDAYDDDEQSLACWWPEQGWLPPTTLPASGNANGITAVALMRNQPPGKDGHFVAFEATELDRITTFLVGALEEPAPTVVP